VQGVQNVKKSSLAPYYIFVAPPSMTSLESRLRGRGTEAEEDIQRRLANAEAELNYGKQTENFDLVLINDDLTKTFELLVKNIQKWYPHLKQILKPRPVVFAGPSGVGKVRTFIYEMALSDKTLNFIAIHHKKGTLIKMLMERFTDQQLGFSVSHTTRKPREGEVDGVHYHFTTVEKIRSEIAEEKFLEYAEVHGNYYGTSIAAVEQVQSQGRVCILDIDIQGVQNVKKSALKAYYVFLAPPSMEELEKRLRGRGTEDEASIQKRLKNASEELDYGQRSGNFDRVFINADLNATLQDLVETFQLWYPLLNEIAPDDPPPKNCTCILS
jgi:guanylate kinase